MVQVRLHSHRGDDISKNCDAEQCDDDESPQEAERFLPDQTHPELQQWGVGRLLMVGSVTLPSTALALDIISTFLVCFFTVSPQLAIANAGIEACVAEVHNEIQQERECGDNQIDALDHREILTNQRLKEETSHTR